MDALWKVPEVPSLIKIGEVSSIDPAKCTARVVFDDEDGLVSYDLPILQRNSLKNHDFAMLDVGEDAIVLFFGEGQEDGRRRHSRFNLRGRSNASGVDRESTHGCLR